MTPGKYDIKIYRGSTWHITINADNAVGVATNFGTQYDTFRMQIRPPWVEAQGDPLLELTTGNGRISLEAGGVQLKLEIPASVTAGLDFNEGVYDLELVTLGDPTPDNDVVDKILTGSVEVMGEKTV